MAGVGREHPADLRRSPSAVIGIVEEVDVIVEVDEGSPEGRKEDDGRDDRREGGPGEGARAIGSRGLELLVRDAAILSVGSEGVQTTGRQGGARANYCRGKPEFTVV
jgi:hypothetical protein